MNDTITERPWYAEFFERNAWALALIAASIIAQWTIIGYRLTADEKRLDAQSSRISAVENNNQSIAITLAGIQKDIEYIKIQVDKITPQ